MNKPKKFTSFQTSFRSKTSNFISKHNRSSTSPIFLSYCSTFHSFCYNFTFNTRLSNIVSNNKNKSIDDIEYQSFRTLMLDLEEKKTQPLTPSDLGSSIREFFATAKSQCPFSSSYNAIRILLFSFPSAHMRHISRVPYEITQ